MTQKEAERLQGLVGLKRQKAEQEMLSIQQEARRIGTEIEALNASLQQMDVPAEAHEAAALARRYGHDRKLVSDIAAREAALADSEAALAEARQALKRAMYSEDRLGEL